MKKYYNKLTNNKTSINPKIIQKNYNNDKYKKNNNHRFWLDIIIIIMKQILL